MLLQFSRLLIGLTIALFHAQLADFLSERDRELGAAFRERGIAIPGALPKQVARDLFFVFGVLIALFSLARIWLTLH
jgi:hypothetical protein